MLPIAEVTAGPFRPADATYSSAYSFEEPTLARFNPLCVRNPRRGRPPRRGTAADREIPDSGRVSPHQGFRYRSQRESSRSRFGSSGGGSHRRERQENRVLLPTREE